MIFPVEFIVISVPEIRSLRIVFPVVLRFTVLAAVIVPVFKSASGLSRYISEPAALTIFPADICIKSSAVPTVPAAIKFILFCAESAMPDKSALCRILFAADNSIFESVCNVFSSTIFPPSAEFSIFISPPLAVIPPTVTSPVAVSVFETVTPPLFAVAEFIFIPPSPVFVMVIFPLCALPVPLVIWVPSL